MVNELKIDNNVFLLGRNYHSKLIPKGIKVVIIDKKISELAQVPSYGIFRPFWLRKKLYILDNLINKITNDKFICYLPSTNNFLFQSIITHYNCLQFNIIEEGLLSYCHPNRIIKQTNQKYKTTITGRIKYYSKYFSHYNRSSFFRNSNSTLGKIYLIGNSKFELDFDFYEKLDPNIIDVPVNDMSNSNIFIFDNLNTDIIDKKTFDLIVFDIFTKLIGEKIFIKFHPAQSNIDEIIKMLKFQNINYEIISNDLPLEIVFLKSKNLTIYGIWSSLLFYASNNNHKVISFIKTVNQMSEKAKNWAEIAIPEIFYKNIILK